ncbi:MAG: hypothetical protein ABNH26_11090 [Celeribacter sp.]|jgi:hypothetical protein
MMHEVFINEAELSFLELFRIALSAETLEDRLAAIQFVRHEVIATRLQNLTDNFGPHWTSDPRNKDLVELVALKAAERDSAVYEFSRVCRIYEDRNERRLNIAEHAGKIAYLSVLEGKREGVQTPAGILYQLTLAGRKHRIRGAKDKDVVRRSWSTYRGSVHLGMAMDFCEDRGVSPEEVFPVAEQIRRVLSDACPRGTNRPYVPQKEQISFTYASKVCGPRFQNRGLPFGLGN